MKVAIEGEVKDKEYITNTAVRYTSTTQPCMYNKTKMTVNTREVKIIASKLKIE